MDFTKMSTAELDQLIADAAAERSNRQGGLAPEPPQTLPFSNDPLWRGVVFEGHLLLSIQHYAHAWIGIRLTRSGAAELAGYLVRIAMGGHLDGVAVTGAPSPANVPVPPVAPQGSGRGGGTVH